MLSGAQQPAVRWHGRRDVRLEQVDRPPDPGPGMAKIAVSYCGICGTDIGEYREGPFMIREAAHPLTGQAPPLTLGHEFSGRVVAVGSDVDVEPGTRVTVDACWRCGHCEACVRGDYHLCRQGGSIGLHSDGAFAPEVVVPSYTLVPLPDAVDDDAAALSEPLAVALHALDRGQVQAADDVLVIGFGPIGAGVALLSVMSPIWIDAITVMTCVAVVLLSIVVLTGYTGQLSLAQYAFAGFGAWVGGRLLATTDIPFLLGCIAGIAATIPLGVLFGLPAVRTRGINLAIVTLGLGSAIELVLFSNTDFTGGFGGTQIGDPELFGWDINAASHPTRYGLIALACLLVATLVVGNIRRGRTGRRLIAVRTNERAAAALGISVPGAKLYAFAVAAAIAGLGGLLIAFRTPSISFVQFDSFTSITMVAYAMIGGLGYLFGPVIGAALAPGAVAEQLLNEIDSGIGKYIPLIGGIALVLLLLVNQNGIVRELIAQVAMIRSKLPLLAIKEKPKEELPKPSEAHEKKVSPKTLEVEHLTVEYGGTVAVDDISLTVRPGQVLGLIGPNGAGKTSLIDAVTGFTKASPETVLRLDANDISRWSATKRARAGMGRSFQSLELFEDSTVMENLRAASDPRDFGSYVRDLVWPVDVPLPDRVISTINEFELEDDLDATVEDLSYGRRRLLAMARAVATESSVLLLDEPAAGLGDGETAELAHLVSRLAKEWGIAVLLVEHDMNFVMSVCDELVVLDFGRKIAEGPPSAVRNNPAVIAAYLGEEETDEDFQHGSLPASTSGQEGL